MHDIHVWNNIEELISIAATIKSRLIISYQNQRHCFTYLVDLRLLDWTAKKSKYPHFTNHKTDNIKSSMHRIMWYVLDKRQECCVEELWRHHSMQWRLFAVCLSQLWLPCLSRKRWGSFVYCSIIYQFL